MPASQPIAASYLLELDQRAEEVLGMEEQHRLAVGAEAGLAVAQNPRPLPRQPVARGADVGDLIADMVDPAAGIAGEESGDRRCLAERMDQLDLGVGQIDED